METISAKFLWGNALFGGKLQMGEENSNFENFESALNMQSVSMPLIQNMSHHTFVYNLQLLLNWPRCPHNKSAFGLGAP